MIVPQIDVDRVARRGSRSPELGRGKADTVEVLGLLAQTHGVGIGKDEHAVIPADDSSPASCVAWQACVSDGMMIAGHDAIALPEARGNLV